MHRIIRRYIHRLSNNPALNMIAGVVLLISGTLEIVEAFTGGIFISPFGAHHGVALFGLLQVIKALPDTMKAFKFIEEGDQEFVDETLATESVEGAAYAGISRD